MVDFVEKLYTVSLDATRLRRLTLARRRKCGDETVMSMGKDMLCNKWWIRHGDSNCGRESVGHGRKFCSHTPTPNSGVGVWERNWRAYDVVHSKNRNRLTLERANDLFNISASMRLWKRSTSSESFAEWDKALQEEKPTYLSRTHNHSCTMFNHMSCVVRYRHATFRMSIAFRSSDTLCRHVYDVYDVYECQTVHYWMYFFDRSVRYLHLQSRKEIV